MHFDIDARGAELPLEARAYLEYRLFSALGRFGPAVFAVRVQLRSVAAPEQPCITCQVQVLLRSGEEPAIEASGSYLYAAIDRAAELAEAAVENTASHV
ncbi:MAG TPA: HPF/RaiA family ribosome-associated protein [Vicinamibacterales bacterium]